MLIAPRSLCEQLIHLLCISGSFGDTMLGQPVVSIILGFAPKWGLLHVNRTAELTMMVSIH